MTCALRAQDTIPEIVIDPAITRDAEIIPTGETNAICIANTGTPAPAITLCSTLALTGKTVLYKIPEFAFGSIPAGNPLVIVTNSSSAALCNGDGAIKAVCWHNGTSYVSLSGGGGVADPGANGLAIRSALNTLIARSITGTSGRIVVTNGDGVAGNPTLDTGADVAHKNVDNTYTSPQRFNDKLVLPRKATPGDLGLLDNGEIFVDGELAKFKSNTGVLYTLYKVGDTIVRLLLFTSEPTADDDSADGYLPGDLWISDQGTADPNDDTIFVAVAVDAGAAKWVQIGGSGAGATRIFDGANSPETALIVRDGSGDEFRIYIKQGSGPVVEPVCDGVPNGCNKRHQLAGGKIFALSDQFDEDVFRVAENTGAPLYPHVTKRPRKWVSIPVGSLRVDGTHCVVAARQLGGGPTLRTLRCADNGSGVFEGKLNFYGSKWDGSPLKIRLFGTHGTTETITFASDAKAQCRGLGDAVNNTWSSTVNVDVSIVTANLRVASSEVDLTPNGTCQPDDKVYFHFTIDATAMSANAANFDVEEIQIGFLVSGE